VCARVRVRNRLTLLACGQASYEATRQLGLDVDPNGNFRGMGDVCPVTGKYRASY
jgi:hypothetical protein